MSCKCKKKPCNCNDVPKITPDGYHTASSAGGIVPSQYYPANGVVYPTSAQVPYQRVFEVPVETGSTAVDVYQSLILLQTNPSCIEDMPDCQSPVGVIVASVTTTTAVVVWTPNETALTYSIKASVDGANVFNATVASTVSTYEMTGLSPDTEYHITVGAVCDPELDPSTCTSVTIVVNTLGVS